MTNRSLLVLLAAAMTVGACNSPPPPPNPPNAAEAGGIPGGWTRGDLDTALAGEVTVQAIHILHLDSSEAGTLKLLSLETQVVAGLNVRASLAWNGPDGPKTATVRLFRSLDGTWHQAADGS